jgi:formate dehydrogenase
MLARELDRLRAHPPYLGMPELILRRGGGSYVTGEASALLDAIEGKAGRPRLAPLDPAQVGLFGRPTLVHGAETLYWVRQIVEQGGAAFAALGVQGAKGLRAYSVSGRVRQPGLKLAPAGLTIRALIDQHCGGMQDGHRFYGYLPGGASGGILPASMGDVPLDHAPLAALGCALGPAAVVVLSQQDRAIDAARAQLRFLQQQACGQCAPCVEGSARALALTAEDAWDAEALAQVAQALREGSRCGLGRGVPVPIESVLRHFPHELSPVGRTGGAAAG